MNEPSGKKHVSRGTADCYSEGERAAMRRSQDLRGRCLRPLLVVLKSVGIGPDQVTFVSLVFGLAFCPLYAFSPAAAVACLWLHVLLDGVDGPLARFTGVASRRGSFTDAMADQTVVAATTITLMADTMLGVWAGGVYLFLYTLIVAFAMVRNALRIPYAWVVRPRFFVYLSIVVELYLLPRAHVLTLVVWVCNGLLLAKVLTGFWKIRHHITQLDVSTRSALDVAETADHELDGRSTADTDART